MLLSALIVLTYLGMCAVLFATQRQLIYHPQLTRTAPGDTDFELLREGVALRGWIVNPGRADAILYFGGNAESVQYNRANFASWFPGSTSYLLAYRGYGASDGTPDERALYGDALALYDTVRARQPNARISVLGRSLGSAVATYLASRRPVARLALVTPFDSLAEVAQAHFPWLPARLLVRDRYDSVAHLASYRGPVLVIRAGADVEIPAPNTARLIASLGATVPTVVELPTAGHNTVDEYPRYGATLAEFMR
jgi:pimeloyl-ACP methyl ester carboxylesterase